MKTTAVFLPFDLFGSAGAGTGVQLLAEAFDEMQADNRRERRPTRARAYKGRLRKLEFAFDNLDDYRDWRDEAKQAAHQLLTRGDFVLWITGNHLGTLPLYEALGADSDTLVIQFDAHLDIYNLSDCTTELSHGNFLLHAAGPLPKLLNVGHRELLLTPEHIGKYYQETIAAAELAADEEESLARLRRRCQEASRIFIDIDCDVFDPAFFPGVAHPLPFGLAPRTLLTLIDAVWSDRVAGVAISEFDPGRDRDDRSLATLVWLLEYLLLRRYEK